MLSTGPDYGLRILLRVYPYRPLLKGCTLSTKNKIKTVGTHTV